MTTLIGYRWKCSDVWSRVVLITRKLPFIILFSLESKFLSSQILKRATLDAFSEVIVIPSCQCKKQLGTGKPVRIRYKNCWWLQRGGSPLPIPNREVKLHSADGTAFRWESRSPPTQFTTSLVDHVSARLLSFKDLQIEILYGLQQFSRGGLNLLRHFQLNA